MRALSELVGDSPGIAAIRETIGRLLQRHSETRRLPPILIQGETGSGKGLVARTLHGAGPRANGPFVDVNCAAIPGTLLEAEMFGFERGAFTDARHAKRGLFQAAHHGTIFLDEVGLLPEALQSKLLKVIEEREVRRLGSTRSEPVDVWILTATSENLTTATRERRFREDLYHRLAVLTLWLPPLRERGSDIVVLAEHYLARACAEYDLPAKRLTGDARRALAGYGWPGNVRELANVMERVALLSEAAEVTSEILGLPAATVAVAAPPSPRLPLEEAVGSVERERLLEALGQTGWNISRAAVLLGIPRNTLRYRIEKHELRPEGGGAPRPRGAARAEPPPLAPAPAALVAVAPVAVAPATLPPPPAPAAAVVRWERRRITLLRAVLLSPGEDPGDADRSRPLALAVEKVQTFGGRLVELGLNGIVAAFGLEPVEDAPARAAHAALAIQRAAARQWDGLAAPFAVKAAIHAGPFLLGRLGARVEIDQDAKRTAWPVLDTLLAAAEPGTIVVSDAASRLLERRFELSPAPLAGTGTRGYRLEKLDQASLRRRLARFVGRQHELELLRGVFASAARGQGQVVALVGEAGIGKSRLLLEFRQGLTEQRVTYLEGHCVSYGTTMPYLPLLDLVRASCGILDTDTPEAIRAKVGAALSQLGMVEETSAPCLLHLLGVKEGTAALDALSPEAINARTFETLRQMSLRASLTRPLIVVVEDLHWIDRTSEEYFASLVESFGRASIMCIATYRPGHRPAWLERSYATQVALRPLSAEESRVVVRSSATARELSPELTERIVAKAQGNPFFLEELARSVGEDPAVATAVPDTIQELLLGRIDRLPDHLRRLLQTASVFGQDVPLRLLGAIWEGAGDLAAGLRELTRLEFLVEQTGLEEPVHGFRHTLTQEVAYATLLDPERRRYHRAVGRALEQQYADRIDEVVELLAHHFRQSTEDDKAVDYAILAAQKAQRRWGNAQALAHFEAALERLAGMPDSAANRLRRIDAVVKQAEVKFALGQHADHIRALEGIRDLVEATGDPRRRAEWYYWAGFLHVFAGGRPEVAIAFCREAAEIAEAAGFADLPAYAECCLAQAYFVAGDLRHALASGERALASFEARGDVWWACRTLWLLGFTANALGDWSQGLAYCRRALEHGQAVNDLRLKVVGWYRTGSTHIHRGDLEAGLQCFREALALAPNPLDAAMIKAMHGYGVMKAGQVAAGTAELAEAMEWFGTSNLRYTRTVVALWLGEGHLRHGDRDRARRIFEEALAVSREVGYRYAEGVATRLLGECLAPADPAGAGALLEAAARVLEEVGARNELAKALTARAEIHRAAGETAEARSALERALALFEAAGTLDEPSHVRAALAALAGERPA
jgi:transcriptional regulator with AAA-type ATPase domain/tetratricopeptide (TPR) repeat protein